MQPNPGPATNARATTLARVRIAGGSGRGALWIGAAATLIGAAVLAASCCQVPARSDRPLARVAEPLQVDGALELARRHAPWIFHETDDCGGRQDLPTRVDFDGNLRGDDDWENFAAFELPPVVYYAVVATETHWFLSYHLFHPRDWCHYDVLLHMTHENDGENLQVVVERATDRVVLLLTQAHYRAYAHAPADAGFAAAAEPLDAELVQVDDEGRPSLAGAHPCVVVAARGHGIEELATDDDVVATLARGAPDFRGRGVILRPPRASAADGVAPPLAEPSPRAPAPVEYALASTVATFWAGVRDGDLVGDGKTFDGPLRLATPELTVAVPRYYDADRTSGPFGPDRGISPFALDFRFCEGECGALLFDPARRYAACLRVPQPWSTRYVDFPWR